MTAQTIPHRDWNINPNTGASWNRNRKEKISKSDFSLDSHGNIKYRKPVKRYDCFGNPICHYRGEFDQKHKFKDKEPKPNGCAGCPSRIECAEVAHARIDAHSDLIDKRDEWHNATQQLNNQARLGHPTFYAFADACDQKEWTTNNDDLQRSEIRRKRIDKWDKLRVARRGRALSDQVLAEIHDERVKRERLLDAAVTPRAKTWLRNLTPKSIRLTCDVWEAREVLERQRKGEVTGGDIARHLIKSNASYDQKENVLRVRVNEALKRCDRLTKEPVEAPVWPDDMPDPPRSPGQSLNGVIWEVLEDE